MNKNELRNTILSQIQLPCIGKNRMQVEPVSGQMQTRQLQQAIDDLSWRGGGTLVLQPGVYRTGALHLKNGVELHLASEDTLVQFVPDDPAENYPLVFSHWEASPCYNFSALLYACDAQDIAVTGKGVLDGGADADHWWNWHHQVETSWSENKLDLQLADRRTLRSMNLAGCRWIGASLAKDTTCAPTSFSPSAASGCCCRGHPPQQPHVAAEPGAMQQRGGGRGDPFQSRCQQRRLRPGELQRRVDQKLPL